MYITIPPPQTQSMFLKPTILSVSMAIPNPTKLQKCKTGRILVCPGEAVLTANRVAMVSRLSQFSRKWLKLQRGLC